MARAPKTFNFFINQPLVRKLSEKHIGMVDLPLLSVPSLQRQLVGHRSANMTLEQLEALTPEQKAKVVLVVQDPTMQRRTMATFARVCRDEPDSPQWISHPGFTPTLQNGNEGVEFSEGHTGLWPVDRYLSLVMGELPRLYDDANGYGPAGRDYIAHVEFPEAVMAAWKQLQQDPVLKGARKII